MMCPYCKSSVPQNAPACAKCARDLRTDEAKGLIAKQEAQARGIAKGCLSVVGVIVALICGWLLVTYVDNRSTDDLSEFKKNIGRTACNATNGVYRGKITGVRKVSTPGGEAWVYDLDYEGESKVAPVDNVTFPSSNGKCPDGRPE